jgi:hypothetical protein
LTIKIYPKIHQKPRDLDHAAIDSELHQEQLPGRERQNSQWRAPSAPWQSPEQKSKTNIQSEQGLFVLR